MKLTHALVSLLCSFSASLALADQSVLGDKEARRFRLVSVAKAGQCLKCVIVKGAVGEHGQQRSVFTWGKDCAGRDSEFLYENRGDHYGFLCGERDAEISFMNRPGIDPRAEYKAEQLFAATPISQEELNGSMIVDLLKNGDGSYSISAFDEESEGEGVKSPPFCLADENSKQASVNGSARIVKYSAAKKECARLSLNDLKAVPLPRPKPERQKAGSGR